MSIRALAWAGKKDKINYKTKKVVHCDTTAQVILYKIADHFNDSLGYSYPSQKHIADLIKTSRETVNKHIKYLVDNNVIIAKKTPNQNTKYYIPDFLNGCEDISQPNLDVKSTSHDTDNNIYINTLNNNKLLFNASFKNKTVADRIWQDWLSWLQTQNQNRSIIGLMKKNIMGKLVISETQVYEEMEKVFEYVYANKKNNLTEYLIKASKEINRRLDKPKELTPVQRDMIEGWIDKIYKKSKSGDNRYFGEDYDAIRTAFTKAMLHGVAEFNGEMYTTRKIREYYDIV